MPETVTVDGPPVANEAATVSASALALHLDCSRTYIGKLEAEGVIQRQGDGFLLDQSRVAYLRYLRRERQQSPRSEADADHIKVKTEMLQLRLMEKKRELLRQSDVDELIDQIAGITLTHLSGMAARCSRDMVVRRNIDAVVMQIRREIAEAYSKAAVLFIPERSCSIAYADRPVPIGHGQTISQPFIVALMTQLAEVAPDHVVLEVGTGSGYQAAILAHLARKVCTIEIIPPLAEAAAKTLRDLAYDNVSVRLGDGYGGWPECGPFDAIVVTAALGQVPPPLIEQLKVGGRLVMPVGAAYTTQHLTVVEKIAPGKTTTRAVALVRFVPFTRSQN